MNALEYGAAEKPVRVQALSSSSCFELSVANAGEPIDPGALAHLSSLFRSSTKRGREGLGLGLYIAHEIARPMAEL